MLTDTHWGRLDRTSFFGETQGVDFGRVSRRSGVRYWGFCQGSRQQV